MTFAKNLESTLIGTTLFFILLGFALLCERIKPAQAQSLRSTRFNFLYTLFYLAIQTLIVPIVSSVTIVAVNASGGGWLVLPDSGWQLIAGVVLYTVTLDCMEYLFHRAQHRLPFLWSMHSLHHSDSALNATTTNRHFWGEQGLKMVSVYLVPSVLFKANATILGLYAVLSLYNIFLHMNLRVGYRNKWTMAFNSPQYHRLHHSALPEHYDCNFAALFPVFDVVFGTFRRPLKDEYPPTGIDGDDKPSGMVEAICWPARTMIRR